MSKNIGQVTVKAVESLFFLPIKISLIQVSDRNGKQRKQICSSTKRTLPIVLIGKNSG